MKLLRILFPAATILTMAMSSCDSYLDIEPKGRVLLESTEDYLGLLEDIYPSYDCQYLLVAANESSWGSVEDLKNYVYPLRSATFFWDESYDRAAVTTRDELYYDCYRRITNYNIIISNVASSDGKDSDKELALAQAKIMRAYNYFILINTYAAPYDPSTADNTRGIIVRERMFESIEDKGIQQSVGYTYRLIQQDIDDAIEHLPHAALNAFRPDRTFGLALKAKVHMFKREFDECIQACLEALDEAPSGSHSLWNMNEAYNTYAPNLIRRYYTDRAIDDPMYAPYNASIEHVWKNVVEHGFDSPDYLLYQFGTTHSDPYPLFVSPEIVSLFDDSDLRALFCLEYRTRFESAPAGARVFASQGIKWNPGGMRFSEIYLMLAECYARKGTASDLVKASDYLETLRSNRNITGQYTRFSTDDPAEALKFVREERRRELFMTYNGFFDMRRFCTEFNEVQKKVFDGETYTLSPGSPMLLFPFPLDAVQNSNLIQNCK